MLRLMRPHDDSITFTSKGFGRFCKFKEIFSKLTLIILISTSECIKNKLFFLKI